MAWIVVGGGSMRETRARTPLSPPPRQAVRSRPGPGTPRRMPRRRPFGQLWTGCRGPGRRSRCCKGGVGWDVGGRGAGAGASGGCWGRVRCLRRRGVGVGVGGAPADGVGGAGALPWASPRLWRPARTPCRPHVRAPCAPACWPGPARPGSSQAASGTPAKSGLLCEIRASHSLSICLPVRFLRPACE